MGKLYKMKWDYRFTFGKYKGQRVDEVFQNGWYGKTYIAWSYYNCEDLTFTDEILDAVGIADRIEKNGANPQMYFHWLETIPRDAKEMIDQYQKNVALGKLAHQRSVVKKYFKKRLAEHESKTEKELSAGRLQWKNQGH